MTANRRIAAGIDQRVRQLAGQNLSDSALVDQMVAYMADLQALWNSTTDEELDALCEEYPDCQSRCFAWRKTDFVDL